jgi:DNA-binding beta-propeller fold protein YncE
VWVADGLGDAVTRIDVATAELLTPPIPVGDQPSGLVFDGTSVWTSDFAAATLTKLRAR